MGEHDGAGQARWGGHPLLDHVEHAALLVGREIGDLFGVHLLLLEAHRGVGAIHLRGDLDVAAPVVATHIAGDVVPQHLDAILRNREGVVATLLEVGQAVAVVDRLHQQGALFRRVLNGRRHRGGAMGGVDGNPVALRVALEQRQLAIAQLVAVLLGVGRGDDEQRFLVGEGVGQEAVGRDRAGVLGQPAGPGGDAAVGVAFLLRAEGVRLVPSCAASLAGTDARTWPANRPRARMQPVRRVIFMILLPEMLRSSRRSSAK